MTHVLLIPLLLLGSRVDQTVTPESCTDIRNLGDFVCCDIPDDPDPHCTKPTEMSPQALTNFYLVCGNAGGEAYMVEDVHGCFDDFDIPHDS